LLASVPVLGSYIDLDLPVAPTHSSQVTSDLAMVARQDKMREVRWFIVKGDWKTK
jgi:hypothetical protein